MLLKLQQEYQQKPWVQQETVAKPVAPDDNIGDKRVCPEFESELSGTKNYHPD